MNFLDVFKNKKKASDACSDKKEKRNKKKLKRISKDKAADKEIDRSGTPPLDPTKATSIGDVFADHLMQRAKETLGEPIVTKTKSESVVTKSRYEDGTNDDFDIPTISEIAKNAVEKVVCRKEFTELEELQKKINQAKRQLRQITDESEDDDFINLRADNHDLETVYPNEEASRESINSVEIRNSASRTHDMEQLKYAKEHITFNQPENIIDEAVTEATDGKRRSIHDRLGNRPKKENLICLSANRRVEQALYVPGYRRNETEKELQIESCRHNKSLNEYISSKNNADDDNNRKTRSHRDQDYIVKDLRQKVQTKRLSGDKLARASILNRLVATSSINKRIGSRVIVAPPRTKVVLEKKNDAIVNSVVNIQPRPVVPKSKQACKSLLLRAVAEAQKSTALVQPTRDQQLGKSRASNELNVKLQHSINKLSPKRNIIVEVERNPIDMENIDLDDGKIKDEYILASEFIEEYDPVYEPQLINQGLNSK